MALYAHGSLTRCQDGTRKQGSRIQCGKRMARQTNGLPARPSTPGQCVGSAGAEEIDLPVLSGGQNHSRNEAGETTVSDVTQDPKSFKGFQGFGKFASSRVLICRVYSTPPSGMQRRSSINTSRSPEEAQGQYLQDILAQHKRWCLVRPTNDLGGSVGAAPYRHQCNNRDRKAA